MPTLPEITASERARATDTLWDMEARGVILRRPVIFVPGLSDESGHCWDVFENVMMSVIRNYDTHVHILQFDGDDGSAYPAHDDFLGFGGCLAQYVSDDATLAGREVDFVCHSMGGLDTAVALSLLSQTTFPDLLRPNAFNVITFDTPFRGFRAADNALFEKIVRGRREDSGDREHLLNQLAALKPGTPQLQKVWQARSRFLQALDAFWPRGADNTSGLLEVPDNSAWFAKSWEFDVTVRKRLNEYRTFSDTSHSGESGVIADPRAILETLEILSKT